MKSMSMSFEQWQERHSSIGALVYSNVTISGRAPGQHEEEASMKGVTAACGIWSCCSFTAIVCYLSSRCGKQP
jgi:hypothetical protein